MSALYLAAGARGGKVRIIAIDEDQLQTIDCSAAEARRLVDAIAHALSEIGETS